MGKTRVALTLDERMVKKLDRWVKTGRYHSRSEAIEAALKAASSPHLMKRLAKEVMKLDPKEEKALAEEDLASSQADEWPEY